MSGTAAFHILASVNIISKVVRSFGKQAIRGDGKLEMMMMGQRQQQHLTIFNSVEWLIIFFSVWLEIAFLLPTNWHFDRYKSSSRIMVFSFQHHPVGWEGKFLYGKRNLSMYLLRCNKYDEIISFLNSVSASCAYALAFLKKKVYIYHLPKSKDPSPPSSTKFWRSFIFLSSAIFPLQCER